MLLPHRLTDKPAHVRFELLLQTADISVGVDAFEINDALAADGSDLPEDALVSVRASDVKLSLVSRTECDCYGISLATVHAVSKFEKSSVINLNAGVVAVVPHATVYAFSADAPNVVIPVEQMSDILRVVPEKEVLGLVRLMQVGVRVGTLAKWLLLLVNKRQPWIRAKEWAAVVGELEEKHGLPRTDPAAFEPPAVLRYFVNNNTGLKLLVRC
jgi:hypothetical protein